MKYCLFVEKLVYLLWPREADASTPDAFRDRLLASLPGPMHALGAQNLKISVTDGEVAAGKDLHLGAQAPQALVSFWLECVRERAELEALLEGASARHAGYLVVESQPLVLDSTADASGRRSPGFSLVGCIEPADGVTAKNFVETWENHHAQVAIDTQSTFSYVRNEVVRPLTDDAPPWLGIVEEGFPIEALTDRRAFYDAGDSDELFRENVKRMVDSCAAFLSLDRVDSHPMSEYRFF